MTVVQRMDNDGWTHRRHVCMGEQVCEVQGVCVCMHVCVHPPHAVVSHSVSTSAAHRRWCNNNITHLISSAYFASPAAAAAAPSLHIYHIHLIFRNKCSRKRIMHLLYAAFITDTFTWGFAFTVSNGALLAGVPHICAEGGAGYVQGGGLVLLTLALSVSGDKWVDLSISPVTFIKEIWPLSRESSTEL